MAWARLDDQFAFNPKVMAAGNEAVGVFARAVCYCSANETDGFIPDDIAALLARKPLRNRVETSQLWIKVSPGDKFKVTGRKDSGRRRLPDVEVVIKAHGYYIRDYLHYNRARSDARAGETADERANVHDLRAQNGDPPSRPVPIELQPPPPSTPITDPEPPPVADGRTAFDYDQILKEV